MRLPVEEIKTKSIEYYKQQIRRIEKINIANNNKLREYKKIVNKDNNKEEEKRILRDKYFVKENIYPDKTYIMVVKKIPQGTFVGETLIDCVLVGKDFIITQPYSLTTLKYLKSVSLAEFSYAYNKTSGKIYGQGL